MLPYSSLWGCWREQFLPDATVDKVSHALVPKQIPCGLFLVPTCPLWLSQSASASGVSLKSDGSYLGWQQALTKSKTCLFFHELCTAYLHHDVFDVHCVFIWWAALGGCGGASSLLSTCEATLGVLCAQENVCPFFCVLQHKKEMELLKRAQQWGTKMIEGLSYDSWDCSAQRIPKGDSFMCVNVWKQGAELRAGFLISPVYHLVTLDTPF